MLSGSWAVSPAVPMMAVSMQWVRFRGERDCVAGRIPNRTHDLSAGSTVEGAISPWIWLPDYPGLGLSSMGCYSSLRRHFFMSSHAKDFSLLSLKEKEEHFILGQSFRGSGSGLP